MCKPINRNEWYKRSSRLEGVILGVLLLFLPWFDIVSKVQYGEKHKKMKTNIIGLEWITGWSPQVRSRGFITQRLQGNGGFRGIGYRYIYIDISYHRTSSTHHQVILLMPIPYVCIYIYIIYPIYTPFISHIYIHPICNWRNSASQSSNHQVTRSEAVWHHRVRPRRADAVGNAFLGRFQAAEVLDLERGRETGGKWGKTHENIIHTHIYMYVCTYDFCFSLGHVFLFCWVFNMAN